MADLVVLAVDIGASSGRHVAGRFDGQRLSLEEVHRFENGPVWAAGRYYWDLLRQWGHVVDGLRAAGSKISGQIRSVGVDTWGVDFGLLGRGDELLGNPYSYRDSRTDGLLERAFGIVSREEIFAHSGLQFMQFNTLYQLLAMRLGNSPLLELSEALLFMPDLFHWLLTGEKANEMTIASTSQFFDPRRGDWASEMLDKFQIPTRILGNLAQPGTRLGALLPAVAASTGLSGVEVVLPGTHDTASAVLAVPADSRPGELPDWCYISSGTWSLMGVEVPEPVVTDQCLKLNFTNEGGVGGTTRLLKNICGLWLVQECRRHWNRSGSNYSWDDLTHLAAAAPAAAQASGPVIEVDEPCFAAPGDMPEAIRQYCRRTGQRPPETPGEVIRCALEGLAIKYRRVLGWLEELVGGRLETIHVVGGGTQNRLLCQMTADACGRRVVAGPIEATAIGSVMMQAVAAGAVGSIAEAREVIRRSFAVEEYSPRNGEPWNELYERYLTIADR
jgi:rhamnulokinase